MIAISVASSAGLGWTSFATGLALSYDVADDEYGRLLPVKGERVDVEVLDRLCNVIEDVACLEAEEEGAIALYCAVEEYAMKDEDDTD